MSVKISTCSVISKIHICTYSLKECYGVPQVPQCTIFSLKEENEWNWAHSPDTSAKYQQHRHVHIFLTLFQPWSCELLKNKSILRRYKQLYGYTYLVIPIFTVIFPISRLCRWPFMVNLPKQTKEHRRSMKRSPKSCTDTLTNTRRIHVHIIMFRWFAF